MSNLSLHKPCPRTIDVGGITYSLNMNCDRVLAAIELISTEEFSAEDAYDILYDWFVVSPKAKSLAVRIAVVGEIIDKIINHGKTAGHDEEEVISFSQDADYIYAAFRQVYGIDLLRCELHWWEFQALLAGLPSGTRLSDIIEIRTREVPAPDGKNYKQISKILELKARYAIRKPVNANKAQGGWSKLFDVLEMQAEKR